MRQRRRRRRWRSNLLSLTLGVILGLLAGLGHWHSVQEHQENIVATVTPTVITGAATLEHYETPTVEAEPYNDPNIPDEVEEAARYAAELYDLPPELLEAIAWHESRYQPDAVNGDCTGLMQVSLYWHRDRMERLGVTESMMWEHGPNMLVAADFLDELIRRYDGDMGAVLMYYNGDSRVDEHLETGFLSDYARNVLDLAEALETAHNAEEVVLMSAKN